MINDVIYYSSILLCISIGGYFKKISGVELKRSYGAGLGILITGVICGQQIYHSILLVWGNVIIIRCCDKRYVHQMSMLYTWTYLVCLHTYITCPYTIWIHQVMALRLVGLAFEVNFSLKSNISKSHTSMNIPIDDNIAHVEPSAVDIIAYGYFFIGLYRGPYFRWKVYQEYFTSPFGDLGNCRIITEHKLKKTVAFLTAYILLRIKFPSQIYYEKEFYKQYGSDYRYLYNMPQLIMYFLHSQIIMLLCTSICTESGFGIYPAKCKALPGHGPSTQTSLRTIKCHKVPVDGLWYTHYSHPQEYNFAMLKCFDNNKLLIGPRMNNTLRAWDMATRYWFWANVYKSLLKSSKEVRSAVSFLAWALWCGPSIQQWIVSSTLWVHIHLEEEYSSIYDTTGSMKAAWNIGFSIMRLLCLIYLTPCFTIADTSVVFRYYNSIFWMFHLLLFVLVIGAIVAYKSKITTM